MAKSSVSSTDYDRQVTACEKFFEDDIQKVEELERGEIVITGLDAYSVVAQLKYMVNHRWDIPFHLLIKGKKVFLVTPSAKQHQPGNGVVSLNDSYGKSWKSVSKELQKGIDPALFAIQMKELFLNNQGILTASNATAEAYALLLFEIARRLHRIDGNSYTPRKKELDRLPIGVAIMRIVKLFEEKKITSFNDVFQAGGEFYCFAGTAGERKTAIDRINRLYEDSFGGNATDYERELKEMFIRKPDEIDNVAAGLKNMKLSEDEDRQIKKKRGKQ